MILLFRFLLLLALCASTADARLLRSAGGPGGSSPPSSPTVFSPTGDCATTAQTSGGLTVSNGGLSIDTLSQQPGNAPFLYWGCRANNAKFTGKLYFEVTNVSNTGVVLGVGLANGGVAYPDPSGWNNVTCNGQGGSTLGAPGLTCANTPGADCYGFIPACADIGKSIGYSNGVIQYGSVTKATLGSWTAGKTVGVACDLDIDTAQCWITPDVTGTSGYGGGPLWNNDVTTSPTLVSPVPQYNTGIVPYAASFTAKVDNGSGSAGNTLTVQSSVTGTPLFKGQFLVWSNNKNAVITGGSGTSWTLGSFNGPNSGDAASTQLVSSTTMLGLYGSGVAVHVPGNDYFPVFTVNGGGTAKVTFNFGHDLVGHPFVGTPPAGYTAWDQAAVNNPPNPGPFNPETVNIANAPPWQPSHTYQAGDRVVAGPGWNQSTNTFVWGSPLYLWAAPAPGGSFTSGNSGTSAAVFNACSRPANYGGGFVSGRGTPSQWTGATTAVDNAVTWTCLTTVDNTSITGMGIDAPPWQSNQYYYGRAWYTYNGHGYTAAFPISSGSCASGSGCPVQVCFSGTTPPPGDGCGSTDLGPVGYSSMVNRYPHNWADGVEQGQEAQGNFQRILSLWYGGKEQTTYHAGANGESLPVVVLGHVDAPFDDYLTQCPNTSMFGAAPNLICNIGSVYQPALGDAWSDNASAPTTPQRADPGLGVEALNDTAPCAPSCSPSSIILDGPLRIGDYNVLDQKLQMVTLHGSQMAGATITATNLAAWRQQTVSTSASLCAGGACAAGPPSPGASINPNVAFQAFAYDILDVGADIVPSGSPSLYSCGGGACNIVYQIGGIHDSVMIWRGTATGPSGSYTTALTVRYQTPPVTVYNNTLIGPGIGNCPTCIGIETDATAQGQLAEWNNIVEGFDTPFATVPPNNMNSSQYQPNCDAGSNATDFVNSTFTGNNGVFTGHIDNGITTGTTGTVLTVTGVTSGVVPEFTLLSWGATVNGTQVLNQTSGSANGMGRYNVSNAENVAPGTTFTALPCGVHNGATVTSWHADLIQLMAMPGVGASCGPGNNLLCDGTNVTKANSFVNPTIGSSLDLRLGSSGAYNNGSYLYGAGSAGNVNAPAGAFDVYGTARPRSGRFDIGAQESTQ